MLWYAESESKREQDQEEEQDPKTYTNLSAAMTSWGRVYFIIEP